MNTTSRAQANDLIQDKVKSGSTTTWSEIGFSEFPIVAASLKRPRQDTLEYLECIGHDAKGEPIHRGWQVIGSHEYGRPRLPDLDLFVAILKLLEKHNYEKRLVVCGEKQICDIVGIPRGGETYKRLRAAFLRFQTTSYVAKNIFIDPQTGDRVISEGFSIIDSHRLLPDHKKGNVTDGLPPSYLSVGAGFLNRLKNGKLKPLDLALWRELPLGLEKPLYHALDNRLWGSTTNFEIGLCKLARKIGVTGHYNRSQLQRLFKKPLLNLVNIGFLSEFRFEETRTDEEPAKVIVFPGPRARTQSNKSVGLSSPPVRAEKPLERLSEPNTASLDVARVVNCFSLNQFGVEKKRASAREQQVARAILAHAGDDMDVAEFIVEYAISEAGRVNFKMQSIAAVLTNSYPERALAALEEERKREHQRDARRRQQDEFQAAESARQKDGNERWVTLDQDTRQDLIQAHYDKIKRFGKGRSGSAFTPENFRKWAENSARKEFIDQELPEGTWYENWHKKHQETG